ncbi:aspartate aminotransferase family protein [Facilibium subflavum]|uniref:aspartate aminotransferase family protein n=1 Tax=Facilibium subflavum TaxID=2219058 RepID=UPI000E64B8E2|nr:aspartate aminotransferase family protein [Facilibium subflavum]
MNTYNKVPLSFTKGQGVWLWDDKGNRYLDTIAALAVNILGYNHPALVALMREKVSDLIHVSNLYHIPEQENLAVRLCNISGLGKAFFANSGAEANETAIKLARLYGQQKGFENPKIISMTKGFHGRTMAMVSQYLNNPVSHQFSPLLPGILNVPFNDIEALEKMIVDNREIVAIFMEPIQGEAGVILPQPNYLQQVRQLCNRYDVLLILDEVQTAMGRTGKFFAFEHSQIMPDIVTLAKGLANGLPIGVCLAKNHIADLFKPGFHGSTFGGNPFVCAIADKVLDIIDDQDFLDKVADTGAYLYDQLKQQLGNIGEIKTIRGVGLMIGIEFYEDCKDLQAHALKAGILINIMHQNIVRIVPPLIMTKAECDHLVLKLKAAIQSSCCDVSKIL